MKVKVRKLNEKAKIPSYSKPGDAGLDLTATSKSEVGGCIVYGTGLAFEIPEDYVGLIFPRSSLASKDLLLTNHVGVVDSGYRGEVTFKFKYTNYDPSEQPFQYDIGDRIGQLIIIPYPYIDLIESEQLSETERSDGAYGSTGN